MSKDVLVYIEQRFNKLLPVSLELLGIGKTLADKLDGKLLACVLGSKVSSLTEELGYYGAEEIYFVDHEMLTNYVNEPYTKALTTVIKHTHPDIVLVGATSLGRDLAPRVSSRLKTGLTADCTSLDIDEETENLLMTRPAFGGNLMATIVCPNNRPQMSTVRPGVMMKPERNEENKFEVQEVFVEFSEKDLNVEVLETVVETKKLVNIEDANVLISAGRGVGSKEKMKDVYSLAKTLKGEVSGSRAAIENGWIEKERQVGQTGKTVRPDLYFALGISGAIQHTSGMEDSNLIISINRNKEAPIFEVSDLGIIGDINKILPELLKELKQ